MEKAEPPDAAREAKPTGGAKSRTKTWDLLIRKQKQVVAELVAIYQTNKNIHPSVLKELSRVLHRVDERL